MRKDDGCTDALKAVSVARGFIADTSVAGVIGPMCTTGAQAADPLYEAAHIIHVSPSATRVELSQQGERYFFRTAWSDDLQADIQASYARDTAKAASAVVIDDSEPYGKGLSDAFAAKFQSLGGTLMSHERIDRGTVDFSSTVKGVMSMNPDMVVFEGLNPEAALLVKELRNQQYAGIFMAPDGVFSAHDYLDAAGAASDGSIISGGPQPDADFIAKFQAKYQRAPQTAFVLQAYDAATALIGAIDATATAGSDGSLHIDRARLADALRSKKSLGLTGALSFDAYGDRVGTTPAEVGLVLYKVDRRTVRPAAVRRHSGGEFSAALQLVEGAGQGLVEEPDRFVALFDLLAQIADARALRGVDAGGRRCLFHHGAMMLPFGRRCHQRRPAVRCKSLAGAYVNRRSRSHVRDRCAKESPRANTAYDAMLEVGCWMLESGATLLPGQTRSVCMFRRIHG